MKQTTITLVMFGALFTGSLTAYADSGNPFGFETNTHPLEYEYCKKEPGLYSGHGYKCSSAPRPHPDLEVYQLLFVENIGLCSIMSFSNKFADIDISLVNDFLTQLESKYGPPTKIGNPLYSWSPKDGFNGLGDVEEIKLDDIGSNSITNYYKNRILVAFKLVPFDACKKKIDEKGKNAF